MEPTRKMTSFTRSDTRIRNSPKSSVSSGIPSCPGGKNTLMSRGGAEAEEVELGGQVTYVVRIELAVSGQAVEEPLYVRPEDAVTSCVIDLVQMFSQSVPEVEGDLHHLVRGQHRTQPHNPGRRRSFSQFHFVCTTASRGGGDRPGQPPAAAAEPSHLNNQSKSKNVRLKSINPERRQVGEHHFLLAPATSPTSYCGCPAQMSSNSRVRRSPIP